MTLDTERLLKASARLADAGDIPKQAAEILERSSLNNGRSDSMGVDLETSLAVFECRQRCAEANITLATKKRDMCIVANDLGGEQYWTKKTDQHYNEWFRCVENIVKSVNQKKSMC